MKKRFLAVALALALCVGLCAVPVFADEYGPNHDGEKYPATGGYLYINKETGTVVGADEGVTTAVIPSSIDGVPVTAIGTDAFYWTNGLKNVTIPNSITQIGRQAFFKTSLTSVKIPNSVTEINEGAFGNCTTLSSVNIPSSVTKIGRSAFQGCALTSVILPVGITEIEDYAFVNCTSLTSVVIPAGVAEIGFGAFSGCGLASVTIPDSVSKIDSCGFDCKNLKDVYYSGSEEQWSMVNISWGNNCLTDARKMANLHFNSTLPALAYFSDVKSDAYYLDAVDWAVDKHITTGTTSTTFSPGMTCSHAEILTFLWRAAGEPESNAQPPFAVKAGAYYEGAAKWAFEKGMIGKGFDPEADCTRADAVNYIWQATGKGSASYDGRFTDVPASSPYATAVAWAVARDVTTGATATTFSPAKICTRGEIVTFLYRAYQ